VEECEKVKTPALHLPYRVSFVGGNNGDLLVLPSFERRLCNDQRDIAIAATTHRCRDLEQVVRALVAVLCPKSSP
jgi:hypothetical protein